MAARACWLLLCIGVNDAEASSFSSSTSAIRAASQQYMCTRLEKPCTSRTSWLAQDSVWGNQRLARRPAASLTCEKCEGCLDGCEVVAGWLLLAVHLLIAGLASRAVGAVIVAEEPRRAAAAQALQGYERVRQVSLGTPPMASSLQA